MDTVITGNFLSAKIHDVRAWNLVISRGIAAIGAALSSFGMDVWLYQKTRSYAIFALISILVTLPPVLISPIAGFFVDRSSKPKILFRSEIATTVLLASMAILYQFSYLNGVTIAVGVLLLSIADEFRYTAITAIIPEMTTKEVLASVNGVQQAFRGVLLIAAPLLGALGYKHLGLQWLLGIAILSSLYAICVTRVLSLSDGGQGRLPKAMRLSMFVDDYRVGIKWLKKERKLKVLLVHFTFICGYLAIFRTVMSPHILDISGSEILAVVVSAQGMGLLLAGFFLARFSISQKSGNNVFRGSYILGGSIIAFGVSGEIAFQAAMSFLIGASIAFLSAVNQTVWQVNTPQEIQGKIVSIRSVALYVFSPLAIYMSIPASDFIKFNPIGQVFQSLLPVGAQRWSSTLLVFIGVLIVIGSSVSHYRYIFSEKKYKDIDENGKNQRSGRGSAV